MSLFPNKNPTNQALPTPSLYLDIPNEELRPWWWEIRTTLNNQFYAIQNSGIFNYPVLNKPKIIDGSIDIQENGMVNIAQTVFAQGGGTVGIEMGLTRTISGASYIDFHSTSPVTADYDARIIRESGVDGQLRIINAGSGDFHLTPSGTGTIQLDLAWTAITTEVPNGFVFMKDITGTVRKFATVA